MNERAQGRQLTRAEWDELVATVERRLREEAELYIAVSVDAGRLVLTGLITSDTERDTAMDIVADAAPGIAVDDNLELDGALPGALESGTSTSLGIETDESTLEPGDFTDQETIEFGEAATGPTSSLDDDEASSGAETFVPPTDPVGTDTGGIGGLQPAAAVDDVMPARSALDGAPGDEAIHDAIMEALLEDAATRDLEVDVVVEQGRVVLQGHVPYVEDAENAEEVVSRVNGVIDIDERLEVDAL